MYVCLAPMLIPFPAEHSCSRQGGGGWVTVLLCLSTAKTQCPAGVANEKQRSVRHELPTHARLVHGARVAPVAILFSSLQPPPPPPPLRRFNNNKKCRWCRRRLLTTTPFFVSVFFSVICDVTSYKEGKKKHLPKVLWLPLNSCLVFLFCFIYYYYCFCLLICFLRLPFPAPHRWLLS